MEVIHPTPSILQTAVTAVTVTTDLAVEDGSHRKKFGVLN